jgi:hypothetical protein
VPLSRADKPEKSKPSIRKKIFPVILYLTRNQGEAPFLDKGRVGDGFNGRPAYRKLVYIPMPFVEDRDIINSENNHAIRVLFRLSCMFLRAYPLINR